MRMAIAVVYRERALVRMLWVIKKKVARLAEWGSGKPNPAGL